MLARFSIRHPVPMIVFFLVVLIIGFVSFGRLKVDLLPALEFPIAIVVTRYEGAGPQEIESLVSRPLEEIIGTVNNLKQITSTNREGLSVVVAEFNWGTDMNFASLQMREKVDQVKRILPEDADAPLVFKIDPAAQPVLILGISGSQDLASLKQIAEKTIKPRLERMDGVASVSIGGGLQREIQLNVDPARLAATGLSISHVVNALRLDNQNLPGGEVKQGKLELLVRNTGQFQTVGEIADLRIQAGQGSVRLGDIAEVKDGFADVTRRTWMNGKPSIGLSVTKQTTANTVEVADRVNAELQKLQAELPGGVQVGVLADQSVFIRKSILGVRDSALGGGLLALLVIYVFLRNLRSTAVVGLAIPISIITTFAILYFSGLTLNIMSLGGLALGIGMLVDDAIVVLENIYRHKYKEGKPTYEAATFGATEVSLAVIASTLSTMVVFLPIVFVQGLAAQWFRELAMTVSFSLFASLLVSLTLVPLMATWLLKDERMAVQFASEEEPGAAVTAGRRWNLLDALGRFWDRVDDRYRLMLTWAVGHRKTTLGIAAGAFALTIGLLPFMGTSFFPRADSGEFAVSLRLRAGTTLAETERVLRDVEAYVAIIPEVETIFTYSGTIGGGNNFGGGQSGSDVGQLYVRLKPLAERRRSMFDVMEQIRDQVTAIPGAKVTIQAGGFGAGFGGSPVQVNIKGDDLDVLKRLAEQMRQVVAAVPGTREVDTTLSEARPEIQVKLNREKLSAYGLSGRQVADAVRSAVTGTVATRFRVGGNEYDIRVRGGEGSRQDPASLRKLSILTPTGATVALGDLATLIDGVGPTTVSRRNQVRTVTVSADIEGRDLGSVMRDVRAGAAGLALPPGYTRDYAGQNQQMVEAFRDLGLALLLAIVLTYLVMAAQFESFLHPFTIMFSVPLAFLGAVGGLVVTGRSLDVSAFTGVIMLVGIVVKNAIVLVDYINTLRARGIARDAAVIKAGPTRLRPVLMTSLTTILGLLPLALGIGEGAQQQAAMATVVTGGLTLSTLLTLIVVPVVYTVMDDVVAGRFTPRWLRRARVAEPAFSPARGD